MNASFGWKEEQIKAQLTARSNTNTVTSNMYNSDLLENVIYIKKINRFSLFTMDISCFPSKQLIERSTNDHNNSPVTSYFTISTSEYATLVNAEASLNLLCFYSPLLFFFFTTIYKLNQIIVQ